MAKKTAKRKTTKATTPPPTARATTIYLMPAQHDWLRRQALDRAITHGGRADASAVVRDLVDAARKGKRSR